MGTTTRPSAATVTRWLPLAATLAAVTGILAAADTPVVEMAKYAGYALLAVVVPGTLVYRSLRRTPHTLVEDLAVGAAVGLTLELAAWAVFSTLDLRNLLWLWPAAVIVPFLAVPRLRRHVRVRDHTPVPAGWAWLVAGAVVFFTGYLALVFLERNPVLPTSEDTRQYLDLAYQLSLAGEAKHAFPPDLPQVAGEPLYYHWFGYAHMASTSLIGGIDLPLVSLRFAVPALCALAVVLTAVAGWRLSGRPYVGAGAAYLLWVLGQVNFTHPVTAPFGTGVTFVVWHGMSMTYSWVLLLAAIAVIGDLVRRRSPSSVEAPHPPDVPDPPDRPAVPALGLGGYVVAALLLVASSGAKASSLPVIVAALALTVVVLGIARRRAPGPVLILLGLAGAAQLMATAVLFDFNSYGVSIGLFANLERFWAAPPNQPDGPQLLVVLGVAAAFLVNTQARMAGVLPMLWRLRTDPTRWFLLGGTLGGAAIYLVFSQPGLGNEYFLRVGLTFGVLLSAWGFAEVADRARMSRRGAVVLATAGVGFALTLTVVQLRYAEPSPGGWYRPVLPILWWAGALLLLGAVGVVVWLALRRWLPGLRGRGPVVALAGVLLAGAPEVVMDAYKGIESPNGGSGFNIGLPRSRVEAARWVRDHSDETDVVATNSHCLIEFTGPCAAQSFWLSAYAERSVLVEGWGFAPRVAGKDASTFWDPRKLALNDAAFTAPSPAGLDELRTAYRVRWLVVDRLVGREPATLADLAAARYDNGRIAVYELTGPAGTG